MPETARVLRFRARPTEAAPLSPEAALAAARAYLDRPIETRSEEFVDASLSEADTFLGVCATLKDICDSSPSLVAQEAQKLYAWLVDGSKAVGIFDERYYLLGETAILAGAANRLLGKRDEAELWFDRAEAGFRHTINPTPVLAVLAYSRLTLYYDRRAYQRIFELLPSLVTSFEKLGMKREVFKCRFLEAMSLKECAHLSEAHEKLETMRRNPGLKDEPKLNALVLVNLGELVAGTGAYGEAVSLYREAIALQTNQPVVTAHLKAATGKALRQQGHLAEATVAFRAAIEDYSAAGMATLAAYLRVVLSEALIALSRHREAEWEILAALPVIDEQKMVPEGFAAVSLLRESVRRRKTDPNALRELREHLQANS
jgi:tetratricopeptide (TPR) repeat protein